VVLPAELELDPHSRQTVEQDKIARQNVDVLREFAARGAGGKSRKVHFRFLVSPVEVVGRNGRAAALRIERNKLESSQDGYLEAKGSGQFETLETGLVLRSVGYMGVPLPGVPFDKRKGTIPNDHGRVLNPETGKLVPGAYVAGWAKRGPSGVIGTNKKDAEETVAQMLQDIPNLRRANVASGGGDVAELLKQKGVKYVTFADWQRINEAELARGKQAARPRVKLTTLEQMLGAL
ncbi:MAG: NADP oxidoreductase, partial [Planctomycetes bacterium]|nr:NADP oxidoreductase [Planctomycetota bacterium]